MITDFFDAHERHWEDAETLFNANRWANADHLYGAAAECGLKRLMLAFGMLYDNATDLPSNRQDRCHANDIWDRYETYRSGSPAGTGYNLPPNPFSQWHISQRYARQADFDQARAAGHQNGGREVRALLSRARKEGLVT